MEIKTNVITIVWDTSLGHNLSHQEVFLGDWKEKFLEFVQNFFRFNRGEKAKSTKIDDYDFNQADLMAANSWDEFADKLPSISSILKRDKNHYFEFRFEKVTCTIYLKRF